MAGQSSRKPNRRTFLKGAAVATGLTASGCWSGSMGRVSRSAGKKVIVVGIDGMDPVLSANMMKAGELPNLARLRDRGGFSPLGTSMPPQSPVAWANFINGAGPGSHGIFDFIHRHPEDPCKPFYAAAETVGGQTLLRRQGVPFWDCARRGRRPLHLLRSAFQLPAQSLAPRPLPLHQRHGHARHAGDVRHLPALRRRRPRRPTRRVRRQALQTVVRAGRGQGQDRRPGVLVGRGSETAHHRVRRPPRPRRERGRRRDQGPQDAAQGRPMEPVDADSLRRALAGPHRGARHRAVLLAGSLAALPALRQPGQHGPERPGQTDLRAAVVRPGRREGNGPLLHHRLSGRLQRPQERRLRRRRVSEAGGDRPGGAAGAVRPRGPRLRRRAAVLLFLQQRSAIAHVLVGLGRQAPDAHGRRGEEVLRPRPAPLSAARPGRRRPHGPLRRPGDAVRDERPRLRQFRPTVQPEFLAARFRLPRPAGMHIGPARPGLVDHFRVRIGHQRTVPELQRARARRHRRAGREGRGPSGGAKGAAGGRYGQRPARDPQRLPRKGDLLRRSDRPGAGPHHRLPPGLSGVLGDLPRRPHSRLASGQRLGLERADHCADALEVPGVLFCNRPMRVRRSRRWWTWRRRSWPSSGCRRRRR